MISNGIRTPAIWVEVLDTNHQPTFLPNADLLAFYTTLLFDLEERLHSYISYMISVHCFSYHIIQALGQPAWVKGLGLLDPPPPLPSTLSALLSLLFMKSNF